MANIYTKAIMAALGAGVIGRAGLGAVRSLSPKAVSPYGPDTSVQTLDIDPRQEEEEDKIAAAYPALAKEAYLDDDLDDEEYERRHRKALSIGSMLGGGLLGGLGGGVAGYHLPTGSMRGNPGPAMVGAVLGGLFGAGGGYLADKGIENVRGSFNIPWPRGGYPEDRKRSLQRTQLIDLLKDDKAAYPALAKQAFNRGVRDFRGPIRHDPARDVLGPTVIKDPLQPTQYPMSQAYMDATPDRRKSWNTYEEPYEKYDFTGSSVPDYGASDDHNIPYARAGVRTSPNAMMDIPETPVKGTEHNPEGSRYRQNRQRLAKEWDRVRAGNKHLFTDRESDNYMKSLEDRGVSSRYAEGQMPGQGTRPADDPLTKRDLEFMARAESKNQAPAPSEQTSAPSSWLGRVGDTLGGWGQAGASKLGVGDWYSKLPSTAQAAIPALLGAGGLGLGAYGLSRVFGGSDKEEEEDKIASAYPALAKEAKEEGKTNSLGLSPEEAEKFVIVDKGVAAGKPVNNITHDEGGTTYYSGDRGDWTDAKVWLRSEAEAARAASYKKASAYPALAKEAEAPFPFNHLSKALYNPETGKGLFGGDSWWTTPGSSGSLASWLPGNWGSTDLGAWGVPATYGAIPAGLGALYGGYKLTDYILDARRKATAKGELESVKEDYEQALSQQHKTAAVIDDDFDLIAEHAIAGREKKATMPQAAVGLAGAYGILSALAAGVPAYKFFKNRSKREMISKALKARQEQRHGQGIRPIYAYSSGGAAEAGEDDNKLSLEV